MYDGYFAQRDSIPSNDLIEVKFEDLVAAPENEVERIFDRLSLGEIQPDARRNREAYQSERRDHRPKSSPLDSSSEELVRRNWASYFDAFGYETAKSQAVSI